MRHRRWSIALVCVGVVLLAGSVAFRLFAVPALVRFPLNIDETTHYTGTAADLRGSGDVAAAGHTEGRAAVA